jgi:endonuclease YncB( thermonuclease family)
MDGRRQGILASFCWVSWMAAIVVLPTEPAGAESRPSTSCRSEPGGTGKVRAITDGRSFTLDDGREIRLAGIEAPLLPGPGEAGTRAKAGLAARAALESIIAGQNVDLRQNDMPADRYGRTTAFVYVSGGALPESVAHEMLARGFARVSAHVGNGRAPMSCWRGTAARQASLACGANRIMSSSRPRAGPSLWPKAPFHTGGRQGVVGPRSGGTIYVEFRATVVAGCTVTILKRNERMFPPPPA